MKTSTAAASQAARRCDCGCGEHTRPAPFTSDERGWVKGLPVRYVHGHHMRGRKRRDAMRLRAAGNPRWNGGRTRHRAGYIWIRVGLDHPMADSRGYCLEHRLVMAGALQRPLLPSEVVHHRNGDKADNRIENLSLFESQEAHARHHKESTR